MYSNKISREAFPKTRVGILYYSGAGNTECLARIFEKVYSAREDCDVAFCERLRRDLDISSLGEFDILGIGFPIYFRRTPAIIYDIIGQLRGIGRRVFSFCTKAMYSGNVSRSVLLRCQSVGFVPTGNFEIFMPGTDALLFAKRRSLMEKVVGKMHSRGLREKAENFVQTVLKGDSWEVPSTKWYTSLDRGIMKPLERLFTRDYQAIKSGYHVLKDRCKKCLLCVKNCPENNIEFRDNAIVFGNRCDLCLRCIHHCPNEAIQIGEKTLNTSRYWPTVTDELEIVIRGNKT